MKIVFTDLDGTLLDQNSRISDKNLETLYFLNKQGIINVAVTGRNQYSVNKVLAKNLPFDYLIFSTGLGTINFKSQEILSSHNFSSEKSLQLIKFFLRHNLNIFIHQTMPNNHFFFYTKGNKNSDFQQRFKLYENFAKKMTNINNIGEVSQFVIVLYEREKDFFELKNHIEEKIDGIKIIRATSPLNLKYIWLEIYPKNVSKGSAAINLCKQLNIDIKDSIAVGNDYNDIELLQVAGKGYVVKNAPEKLKSQYEVVSSNENNGFSEAIFRHQKQIT